MLAPQGPTKQNTRLYLWYHRTDKRGCLRLGKALGTGHEDSLLGDTPGAGILVATPSLLEPDFRCKCGSVCLLGQQLMGTRRHDLRAPGVRPVPGRSALPFCILGTN